MDKNQNFTIEADTTKLTDVTITGSPDNQMFQEYTRFLAQKTPMLTSLQNQLSEAKSANDSVTIKSLMTISNKELDDYRENVMKANSSSMLGRFFFAMKRPEIPAVPVLPGVKRLFLSLPVCKRKLVEWCIF